LFKQKKALPFGKVFQNIGVEDGIDFVDPCMKGLLNILKYCRSPPKFFIHPNIYVSKLPTVCINKKRPRFSEVFQNIGVEDGIDFFDPE